jgi:hypothetical protein
MEGAPKAKRLALHVKFASQVKVEKVGAGAERSNNKQIKEDGEAVRVEDDVIVVSSPLAQLNAEKRVVASAPARTESKKEQRKGKNKNKAEEIDQSMHQYEYDDVMLFDDMNDYQEQKEDVPSSSSCVSQDVPVLFQCSSTVLALLKNGGAKLVRRKSGKMSFVLVDGTELEIISRFVFMVIIYY